MDSAYPRIGGNIEDVASAADRLAAVCVQLESHIRNSEFLLVTLRREFATWVLRGLEATESRDTSNLDVADGDVLALVRQYVDHATGRCSRCLCMAPLTEEGLCAWGCSPRSPMSMPP